MVLFVTFYSPDLSHMCNFRANYITNMFFMLSHITLEIEIKKT